MPNSNEYMAAYMNVRYHQRRLEAIELLGGKCIECGSTENLEFDHIDPKTKTFSVSKLFSRGRERFLKELKLCQLLCYICHKKKSSIDRGVEHGGGKTGKRNCKCTPCKARKAEYMKTYIRTR